jgi:ATP-binding cassette subfamily B protein RaxB
MISSLLHLHGRSRMPALLQNEASECGLACLAMIASFHGHRIDLNTLRRRYPVSLNGVTLRGLIHVANQMHLASRSLRFEMDDIGLLNVPAIVHWDLNHFVVLKAVTPRGIVVHDPATGVKNYTLAEARKHLTGIALELSPADGFAAKNERAKLPIRAFWGHLRGMGPPLVRILVLSIVLEAFTIAAPLYQRLMVDGVIASGDNDLMFGLGLGFGLLAIITVATNALRAHIGLVVQNAVHFHMGARLFHHLIRLPLSFFEKRHIGDVLSRFQSIEPIRTVLAEGLILSTIDGLMALATLAAIALLSPLLAAVVFVAFLIYFVLRLIAYQWFRAFNEEVIRTDALENSNFIETARAIQSIKLFNRESDREGLWLNLHADTVNATMRRSRARITFEVMNHTVFGLENIVSIYIAVLLVLSGHMTIGAIFAFLSYKVSFTGKAAMLVDKALEFRLLDLHLERIADIALTPTEAGQNNPAPSVMPIRGKIELRNVSFRYAETERFILQDINLTIEPGSFVTITGPSGGGKTTLMKIMLGLLEPTSGEVLIDGVPLAAIGVRAYRDQIGAVMQDDQLLSGTVTDNICFFAPQLDMDRIVASAQMARVHEEIMSMPMGYNSLIGDMGSSLSGGQKQRVLLARALYKQPKILFMDEGTAHLDVGRENEVNQQLRTLQITRISVAHRPDMMTGTDKVLRIG